MTEVNDFAKSVTAVEIVLEWLAVARGSVKESFLEEVNELDDEDKKSYIGLLRSYAQVRGHLRGVLSEIFAEEFFSLLEYNDLDYEEFEEYESEEEGPQGEQEVEGS